MCVAPAASTCHLQAVPSDPFSSHSPSLRPAPPEKSRGCHAKTQGLLLVGACVCFKIWSSVCRCVVVHSGRVTCGTSQAAASSPPASLPAMVPLEITPDPFSTDLQSYSSTTFSSFGAASLPPEFYVRAFMPGRVRSSHFLGAQVGRSRSLVLVQVRRLVCESP